MFTVNAEKHFTGLTSDEIEVLKKVAREKKLLWRSRAIGNSSRREVWLMSNKATDWSTNSRLLVHGIQEFLTRLGGVASDGTRALRALS